MDGSMSVLGWVWTAGKSDSLLNQILIVTVHTAFSVFSVKTGPFDQ